MELVILFVAGVVIAGGASWCAIKKEREAIAARLKSDKDPELPL